MCHKRPFTTHADRLRPRLKRRTSPSHWTCATQSIRSLRSVLGSSEAWRTLLQTLRTRTFFIGLLEMGVRGPQKVDPRTEHGGHARLADQAMTMWTWQ